MTPSRRLVGLSLLSGSVLSFLIFTGARQREEEAFQERFRAAAENRVSAIRRELESALHELEALRAHLETTVPDEKRFAQFAELILAHNPGIHSLEWAPAVRVAERGEFERSMAIRIVEGNPAKPRVARDRPVYYPVLYLYPRDRAEGAIGFDISGGTGCRLAMQYARDRRRPGLTEKFPLVERSGDGYGVLAMMPVFRGEGEPAGFAVAVLQMPDLVARGVAQLRGEGIAVTLYDESAGPAKRLLYGREPPPVKVGKTATARREQIESVFEAGGRNWRVVCAPLPAFLATRGSVEPWVLLLGGLLLTGMLSIHFRVQTEHANQLREINQELTVARDEALEAARLKAQFLANMSHEIRTPMNGLLGLTELAMTSAAATERSNLLEAAHESGQKLLELLNNLLDISRADAGKMPLEQVPVELKREAEHVVRLFQERAANKGIMLALDDAEQEPDEADPGAASDALPTVVSGDPTRLRQVLTNLVNNAVKFTSQGSVTVRLRIAGREGERIRVRFEVKDTGIGIAEDLQGRLFLPFSQGDTSTTRCYGGTGLGLAISKQLVMLMGGEIGVESTPGEGSRFWFTVPFRELRDLPAGQAPPGEANHTVPIQRAALPQSPRVLLAEDNTVNQLVAKRLLENIGCDVITARNGLEAVASWENGPFDLLLMDCQMPELDGYEATREIRRKEGERRGGASPRIPIVALTANAMEGDREACLEAGMDDYLTKPLQSSQLREVILRWLPQAAPPEEPAGLMRH